jgi:hypothetical protein
MPQQTLRREIAVRRLIKSGDLSSWAVRFLVPGFLHKLSLLDTTCAALINKLTGEKAADCFWHCQ